MTAVAWSDIDALHRKITKAGHPAASQRVIAGASKMFCARCQVADARRQPGQGDRAQPRATPKTLHSAAEQERLAVALAAHPDQQGADIFRVCLLTGCRVGEAKAARWEHIDLVAGKWSKPGATTKQRTDHEVPLSAAAKQLFVERRRHTNCRVGISRR